MSLGSTFNFGKYQVESETPWAIVWEIVHQTNEYQIAQTKQIIDLRCFDAKESTNTDSINWSVSNIKQFLNSDQANWYSAQHSYDAPPNSSNTNDNPYDTHKGFLYYFSDEEKSLLKDMTLTLANPDLSISTSYTWTGKVWLPTYTQMGYGDNGINEGTKFDKYSDDNSRIKIVHPNCMNNNHYCIINNFIGEVPWYYWMSSPNIANFSPGEGAGNGVWIVESNGLDGYSTSTYSEIPGLAPCIKLPKTGGLWVKTNSLTWYLNDNIAETATESKSFVVDFTSDNTAFKRIKVTNNTTDNYLKTIAYFTKATPGSAMDELQESNLYSVYGTVIKADNTITHFYVEKYRTLVFNELPSGDLLTWLQANATPI